MAVLKLATHLWFEKEAEEAAKFYISLLPDSCIGRVTHATKGVPDVKEGAVFIVDVALMGQNYIFINGGPLFPYRLKT